MNKIDLYDALFDVSQSLQRQLTFIDSSKFIVSSIGRPSLTIYGIMNNIDIPYITLEARWASIDHDKIHLDMIAVIQNKGINLMSEIVSANPPKMTTDVLLMLDKAQNMVARAAVTVEKIDPEIKNIVKCLL